MTSFGHVFCSICNKDEVGPTSKVLTVAGIRRVVVAIRVAVIVIIAFEFSHIFLGVSKVLTVTGIRRVGLHFCVFTSSLRRSVPAQE